MNNTGFSLPISGSTNMNVAFGDLFEQEGFIVIPVNEFFYTQIGLQVSATSLHGKFIEKFFNGEQAELDELIEKQLKLDGFEPMVRTADGRNTVKYPIGTTLLIEKDGRKFLLCALSRTNEENFEAFATIKNLVEAIEGLCNKARTVAGGRPVSLPVMGSGLSRLNLPRELLINALMTHILYHNREKQITNEINIVAYNDPKFPVDLSVIKNLWSKN